MANEILKAPNGRWMKGTASPNKNGRKPTGLAAAEAIRAAGGDPVDPRSALARVARRMWDVALCMPVCIDAEWQRQCARARELGEPEPAPFGEVIQPSLADAQRASDWLMNHGFTKPAQKLEIGELRDADSNPLLTPDEQEEMRVLRERVAARQGLKVLDVIAPPLESEPK